LAKSILDGLNGVVWKDDKQISHLLVTKNLDVTPHIDLLIGEMNCLLQKLNDSLAIDMSKIGALEIEESDCGDYRLIAYVSGARIISQ